MGIWLNAWAGDHAGLVMGRKQQPFRALVAVTRSDDDTISNVFQTLVLDGTPVYININAICLTTPDAMDAIVTKFEAFGTTDVYSLEVKPVEAKGKVPWNEGVHLFAIEFWSDNLNSYPNTIATVVVPSKVTAQKALSDNANAMLNVLKLRQRRTRAR